MRHTPIYRGNLADVSVNPSEIGWTFETYLYFERQYTILYDYLAIQSRQSKSYVAKALHFLHETFDEIVNSPSTRKKPGKMSSNLGGSRSRSELSSLQKSEKSKKSDKSGKSKHLIDIV